MSTENTIEDLKNRTPGGFGVTVETLKPTEQDIRVLSAQLGRKVRDVVEIPARCVCGNPLVAATAPRLSNGTPFPTVFYLAHPVITAAASRLEAGGLMYEMTDALAEDAELAAAYAEELTGPRFAVWAAEGFAPFLEEYRALCINLGRPVKFEGGQGVAEQVDEEGRLIVRTEAGEQKVFTGEVSVKGVYEDIERTERTPR